MGRRHWIACDGHGVEKRVLISFLLANAAGAVLSFTSGQLANPPARGVAGDMRYSHVFLAYLAVAGFVGHAIAHRIFRGACRWLVERRRPTEEERRAVLAVPWRHAVLSFAMWLGAAAVFGVLNARWESNAVTGARTALSIVLAGLAACAATYLLIERCMRPVYVHALDDGRPRPSPARYSASGRASCSPGPSGRQSRCCWSVSSTSAGRRGSRSRPPAWCSSSRPAC